MPEDRHVPIGTPFASNDTASVSLNLCATSMFEPFGTFASSMNFRNVRCQLETARATWPAENPKLRIFQCGA